jgi:hypothetical protein
MQTGGTRAIISRRRLLRYGAGGLLAAAGGPPARAAAPPLLGCFVGNPNGNEPAKMAGFERRFDRFAEAMGSTPAFMNAFTDFSHDWSSWVDNAKWTAWSWSRSPRARRVTPVIGIPMATNADWARQPAIATFQAIAQGQHDRVWSGIAAAWRDNGYRTFYIRPGYEMDGSFMPWFMGPTEQSVAAWKQAFIRVATVMRATQGASVRVAWNPACINWTAQDVASSYPGDDVVDVIGIDLYSSVWPLDLFDFSTRKLLSSQAEWQEQAANRVHFWDYPSANRWSPDGQPKTGWGMVRALDWAKARGKPVGVCETGVGVDPKHAGQGLADDGRFPTYMRERLFAPGAPAVLFVNLWDTEVGDGPFPVSDGSKPKALEAWRAAFGRTGIGPS